MVMNNAELSEVYKQTLNLRWSPVAVRLMRPGEDIPEGMMEPSAPMRYCQSIIAARRGNCIYMPLRKHACPDGSGILGLAEMSHKLKSGDLYLLFKKLPNLEIAQKMISTRSEFAPGTYTATLVAPLEMANFEPDVVIFTLRPEQAMWMCCAKTYATGDRQVFHTSGYNSTCADLTVQVMKSGEMNVSFGCYGARAASEIDDFEQYVSLPYDQLPILAEALKKLSKKSIPEERRKIYLPPVIDSVAKPGLDDNVKVEVLIDEGKCTVCGLCEAFCPASVFDLSQENETKKLSIVNAAGCSACYTCVGQCPERAIQLKTELS
jgi:uncharacterized protein (DUF169 family)/Pyruvate/2-oxoacid:ferredoxin oxidoreductase delta subunit